MSNKNGQALVEYVLVLSLVVILVVWGFGFLKCYLHQIWVNVACDIIYPYPKNKAENDLKDYCTSIDPDECGLI